ncbi:hypothetical protein SADUNF_Sadunf04G0026400 [Salix dunnii]|uniref:Tetraspanin-19 n=1 Tax=Salix dunnii TaxID=1413687 RepID=A0A835K9U5_9ROSI|nr:hypothetical protein SADUNF_Sadunf04G0026400 [Salix dunnii]
MAGLARTCLQSILKIVNSTLGLVGIAMILYGLWMGRVWQRDMQDSSFDDFDSSAPWFIYAFLSIGVTLCLITCLGYISADCSNGFFLSCYMEIIFVLFLLETLLAADILLNSDWEKDLPEDPTGRLHDFREFVESNFDFFKWIGMFIILSQELLDPTMNPTMTLMMNTLRPDFHSSITIYNNLHTQLVSHDFQGNLMLGIPTSEETALLFCNLIREATLSLRRTSGLVKIDMELMKAVACRHFCGTIEY